MSGPSPCVFSRGRGTGWQQSPGWLAGLLDTQARERAESGPAAGQTLFLEQMTECNFGRESLLTAHDGLQQTPCVAHLFMPCGAVKDGVGSR